MKAYGRALREGRRARDDAALQSRTIEDTMELAMLVSALILHDDFGFGQGRITRYLESVMGIVEELNSKYGAECTVTALRERLRMLGIEIRFK